MTQLKPGQRAPAWKEPEVNKGCEFGVKSYLHQFYDGPESVDFDLYEDEDFSQYLTAGQQRQRQRRRHHRLCCSLGWLRSLLILSILLLLSAVVCLLLLILLPDNMALVTSPADVSAAQVAALTAACLGAAGTLTALCLMLQMKWAGDVGAEVMIPVYRPGFISPQPPISPIEKKVPVTEELISIQPDCPPRYDVTR